MPVIRKKKGAGTKAALMGDQHEGIWTTRAFDFFMNSDGTGIDSVNEDSSPTLGGNLNLNGNGIVSGMIPSLSGTGKSLVMGF